jgi:HEAT repeat protein
VGGERRRLERHLLVQALDRFEHGRHQLGARERLESDGHDASLVTRIRGAVTRPVVHAVGRTLQQRLRGRIEARRLMSGITDEEAIARFLDARTNLAERRVYAYRLAATASPAGIAALLAVLETAPPEDRAFIVQLIGSTGNRAVKPHLWSFLADPDEGVARAAIRGLCVIGGADVAATLADILGGGETLEALRVEAARGLGQMGTAAARRMLLDALARDTQAPVAGQILESLGRFRFSQVGATFEDLLARPGTPPGLRVAAVEALGHSDRDAVPFLLAVAADDADAEVRAAAAWATAVNDGGKEIGPRLAALAEREPEADVRRRLYEALLPQAEIPITRLLPTIGAEQDVAARVAGWNAVGAAVGRDPTAALAAAFDVDVVPELERIASAENSLNVRMRAVFALRRAGTPAAADALAAIATTAPPPVATAARHGLRTAP